MADPLWQEIRSYAGRLQASDLRPLAPGLGWRLKPTEVREKTALTKAGFYSSESLERLRIEKGVPDSTSDPQSQKSEQGPTPSGVQVKKIHRDSYAPSNPGLHPLPERSLPGSNKIRKRTHHLFFFKRLYSLFIDISFITLTIVIISIALVMMTESAVPDPSRVWNWVQGRLLPLLSLQEWMATSGLLISIYFVFFRILVGATLGESITGIRRERAGKKIKSA